MQFSQSKLSKMHCISYGECENKTSADLCFEAQQIQSAQEFHDII